MKNISAFWGFWLLLLVFGCFSLGVIEMASGQGVAACCKDCKNSKATVAECLYQTITKDTKPPIKCMPTLCMVKVVDQNACEPGGDATTCKTKVDPANRTAYYLTVYSGITNCPFGTDTGITTMYRWFLTDKDGENCGDYQRFRVSCRGTLTVEVCTAGTKDDMNKDLPRGGPRHLCD